MTLFKKNKKHLYSQEIEIEDIFLDKMIREKKEDAEIWERKLEVPLKRKMFFFLFALIAAVLGVLLYTSFTLQIKSYEAYTEMANDNKFQFAHFSASRGIIYDRNLKPLVTNEASFDLWVRKSAMSSSTAKLPELDLILKLPLGEVQKIIQNASQNDILVKKNLSHGELILIEAKLNEFPGFQVNKGILRIYQEAKGLGSIIGYLGKISPKEMNQLSDYGLNDSIGKEGIEKYYEKTLREIKGRYQIERNARGAEISKKIIEYPQSGNGLVLSLDLELQNKAAAALLSVMKDVGSKKGSVIVLDPNNGEILAAVSLPSFDNNLFSGGISEEDFKALNENPLNPQFNRIISGLYPTGSTIKPFIAAAALEEKVITENTQLWCPLKICLENIYTHKGECFVDNRFHGTSDVKRAIAESVNPFFYLVGGGYTAPNPSSEFYDPKLPNRFKGLGVERIGNYLSLFGFGTSSGIDLPGEMGGRVPTPAWKQNFFKTATDKFWYLGDTYNLSIGQGFLLATPLQVAVAIGAIANEGKLIQPHLAKKILSPSGDTLQEIEPKIIRENFVSNSSLKVVRAGMRQAVSSPAGSAFSLSVLPVKVAVKTGTAQTSKKEIYENWIAAFAPYEKPEIVLVVLIEEVPGMKVAAQRVAKDILSWYFTPVGQEKAEETISASSTATTEE